MIDVPIQSINKVTLKALDYVFGNHELDHHSHKVSATYTHSVNPDYQASFQQGYPMLSYKELIQPRQEESVLWVMEHQSIHIGYGYDHGLSFASGDNSSARCILMPLKMDS